MSSSNQIGLFTSECWIRYPVENIGNIANTEIPEVWRRSCSVHGSIDNTLESLISSFKGILVLIVRFTGPNLDPKHSEVVKYLVAVVG